MRVRGWVGGWVGGCVCVCARAMQRVTGSLDVWQMVMVQETLSLSLFARKACLRNALVGGDVKQCAE